MKRIKEKTIKTFFYLTEDCQRKLDFLKYKTRKTKSQIIREACCDLIDKYGFKDEFRN